MLQRVKTGLEACYRQPANFLEEQNPIPAPIVIRKCVPLAPFSHLRIPIACCPHRPLAAASRPKTAPRRPLRTLLAATSPL